MRIFVSHSSRDKAFIREVLDCLPMHLRRWLDEEQLLIGMDLKTTIRNVIDDDADYVLLFLSESAIASEWVKKELAWSLQREEQLGREFILPVLIDNVWDRIEPKEFQKRRYLKCLDYSRTAVKGFAETLKDELFGWLCTHLDKSKRSADNRLDSISLTGTWRSTFNWNPIDERDTGESSDLLGIHQTGTRIDGGSVDGQYQYVFNGHIVNGYIVGEWKGRKLPLFGVFQLKIDIDTGNTASGYWIGNGANTPYAGEWKWERIEPSDELPSSQT
jgi:hypothetical protein